MPIDRGLFSYEKILHHLYPVANILRLGYTIYINKLCKC